MGLATESIFNNGDHIIAMALVDHIEARPNGIFVVTSNTTWNRECDEYNNAIYMPDGDKADAFKAAWCRYRSEIEADTLVDLAPV